MASRPGCRGRWISRGLRPGDVGLPCRVSWFFQTKPRRTRAQTAASRRNLYAARAELARRRPHDAHPVGPWLVVLAVCVVGLLVLVEATHGLAVLSAVLVLAAYVMWRRDRSQEDETRYATLLRERLTRSQTIDGMLGLTPKGFEQSVAEIMASTGYVDVAVVGGAGDEGADVRATDFHGVPVVVQCKRYALDHKVGSREAQLMFAAKGHYCAGRALLVTTSTFTAPAVSYARSNGLELIDGQQLALWAHRALEMEPAAKGGPAASVVAPRAETPSWAQRSARLARRPGALLIAAVVVLAIGLATRAGTSPGTVTGASQSSNAPSRTGGPLRPSTSTTPPTSTTMTPSAPAPTSTTTPDDVNVSEAETTAESDSDQVKSQISDLSGDATGVTDAAADVSPDLTSLARDLAQTQSDDNQTHTDAGSPTTASNVCGDASVVAGDVSVVKGDQSNIEGDATELQNSLSPVSEDEANLNTYIATLMRDEASLPVNDQAGLATQADVTTAIANLTTAIDTGQQQVNAALSTAQADVVQAQGYASDAQSVCGVG